MNGLYIFGAGGFAHEVLQVVLDLNDAATAPAWQVLGFVVDDRFATPGAMLHGLPVHAVGSEALDAQVQWVVAIGSSVQRARAVASLEPRVSGRCATLVHPTAWLGRHVRVDAGSVVCAGCQVTTDIRVGGHALVNIGCTVGHDAVLADFVTLNPGVRISGNVSIGEGGEGGSGSVLIHHAGVGHWSIVGAGIVNQARAGQYDGGRLARPRGEVAGRRLAERHLVNLNRCGRCRP